MNACYVLLEHDEGLKLQHLDRTVRFGTTLHWARQRFILDNVDFITRSNMRHDWIIVHLTQLIFQHEWIATWRCVSLLELYSGVSTLYIKLSLLRLVYYWRGVTQLITL